MNVLIQYHFRFACLFVPAPKKKMPSVMMIIILNDKISCFCIDNYV